MNQEENKEDSSCTSEAEESKPDDFERVSIREEISKLSYEELQKLKEKMGLKLYNEAVFDTKMKRKSIPDFKRKNKNRPREMSSKVPVPMITTDVPIKKKELRDPRFDPLCGEFDKKTFKESYKFLEGVRENDLSTLKEQLRECADEEEAKKIKYLIQRIENQQREEKMLKKKKEKERIERERTKHNVKEGRSVEYKNKSEKRVVDLIEQYKELRKDGRLEKHIERKQKKNTQKARKNNRAPE